MPSASPGSARHRARPPRHRSLLAAFLALLAALTGLTGLATTASPAPAQAAMMVTPAPVISMTGPEAGETVTARHFTATMPGSWLSQVSRFNYVMIDTGDTLTPLGFTEPSSSLTVGFAEPRPYERDYSVRANATMLDGTTSPWSDPIPIVVNGQLVSAPGGSQPTPSPAPTTTPTRLKIAAITDSVGSGEGTRYRWRYVLDKSKRNGRNGSWDGTWVADELHPVWEPTTDLRPAVQNCHRSTDAYPYKVAAALNADLLHLGCSGASVSNGILNRQLFTDGSAADYPQLGSANRKYGPPNPRYDAFRPDAVLLTDGANDVQFAYFVDWCYRSAGKGIHRYCDTDRTITQEADKLIKAQKAKLEAVVAEIIQRGKAAGKVPAIFLSTYYDPFPDTHQTCQDILPGYSMFGLSRGEMSWLRVKLIQLNANIRAVARAHPKEVRLVELSTAFKDHGWCSKDPWVYGPSIMVQPGMETNPSPFHPTWYGQSVIGRKFTAAIRSRFGLAA